MAWFDDTWPDGVDVDKDDIKAGFRNHVPWIGTVAELQATATDGLRFAIIEASNVFRLYEFDAADTTTVDDGVNCIVSADGDRYKLRAVRARAQVSSGEITAGAETEPREFSPADIVDMIGEHGGDALPAQVSSGEITAGTETELRSFSPADIVDMIDEHAAGSGGGREVLTANRTYYIRTDGNDANDGLTNSSGGAKATLASAWLAAAAVDFAGYSCTFSFGSGTFAESYTASTPLLGASSITITGAGETSTTLGANSATVPITVSGPITVTVRDIRLGHSSGASVIGLRAQRNAVVLVRGTVGFNAIIARIFQSESGAYIEIASANVMLRGSSGMLFYVLDQGRMLASAATFDTAAAISFTYTAEVFTAGFLSISTTLTLNTTGGAVTAQRYRVRHNAVIFSDGAGTSKLYGATAGTTSDGGIYV